MKTRTAWMLLAVVGLLLGMTGCVAQSELDNMREAYRKTQEQVVDLRTQLEDARSQIAALQQLRDRNPDAGLQAQLDKAIADRNKLQQQLKQTLALLEEARGMQQLPRELSDQLAQLAESNPQLMSYDPDRGMIRLKSDLTFALGSTQVSDQATSTLQRLAQVLNSSAAQPYEVRVVGHTDNVPVNNPANKQKYGDNWGLSAFRAISVKDVLEKAGVSPRRMAVAGYGQYQPVTANGPKGAEANRRVEIFLVQPYQSSTGPAGAATAPSSSTSSQSTSNTNSGNGSSSQSSGQSGQTQPMPQPEPDDYPAAFK